MQYLRKFDEYKIHNEGFSLTGGLIPLKNSFFASIPLLNSSIMAAT